MAIIGYSETGFRNLKNEVGARKEKMISTINSNYPAIQSGLQDAWKGNDANLYMQELDGVIKDTLKAIESVYSTMDTEFTRTYNEWINKQNVK